jgi:hypothetical protein
MIGSGLYTGYSLLNFGKMFVEALEHLGFMFLKM